MYHLPQETVRDNYKKSLELAIGFLVGAKFYTFWYSFRIPGAMHHACWMSMMRSIKPWMFTKQVKLTAWEEHSLRDICVFVVIMYMKVWFCMPLPAASFLKNLNLMKAPTNYPHNQLAKAITAKFSGLLWYLSEDFVALVLLNPEVPMTMKRAMIKARESKDGEEDASKKLNKTALTPSL